MDSEDPQAAPVTLSSIFKVFLVIGCTAFGGGASAHIHHAIVHKRKWIDEKRMLEGITVARIVPGTNVSNLAAFVGSFLAGYRGAAVAVCGVVLPGLLTVLSLAFAYARFAQHSGYLQVGLRGLAAGAVGIMASLVVNNAKPVLKANGGLLVALLAFVGVGVLGVNMLVVLVALTPLGAFLNREQTAP